MTSIVQNLTINGRSIDGVLGIRTRDRSMVGADKSTELWRLPPPPTFTSHSFSRFFSVNYLQRSHRNQRHPAPHVLCNFVVHDWHPIQSSQPTNQPRSSIQHLSMFDTFRMSSCWRWQNSVALFGCFCQTLATNWLTKVAQIFGHFLAIL